MKIIHNEKPNLNLPEFKVDMPLSKYLDEDPLLKHLNKSFCCALISRAGGGKTSLLVGLLNTKKKLNKVFHKIYVFMPNTSRQSMKNSIFDVLSDDQLFEGVNFENLANVYLKLLENSKDGKLSLLIFDDCQSQLKDKEVEVNLLHIIANRRHLRTSVFIIAQNYNKIPRQIRLALTDTFLFNIGKQEYDNIYEENVEISKQDYDYILKMFNDIKKEDPYSFLFIHEKNKFFINWNEIVDDD